MKALVVLLTLFAVGDFTTAYANGATITVGQTADPQVIADMKVDLKRAEQFKRDKCKTKDSKEMSPHKMKSKQNEAPRSYSCSEINNFIEELTAAVGAFENSGNSGNNSACQAAYTSYTTAKTEATKACSKIGSCTSENFTSCREHVEDYAGDYEGGEGLSEYLEACPFFAAKEAKKKAEEVKELDESLEKIIKDIKDLEEKAEKQKKESQERMTELKSEITKTQNEAQGALDDLQTTIQDIKGVSSEKQGAILNTITSLQRKMATLRSTEFNEVRNNYTEQVLKIEQQCYMAGLNAAAAEAKRLKTAKGVAMDELGQQMAAGGAVGYLRAVANSAYQQCLNIGQMARTSKAADDTYQSQVDLIEADYRIMQSEIASLQKSYSQMIKDQPLEVQKAQMQAFSDAQAKAKEAAAKEQEYSNLANELRQGQSRIQAEIGQLATKRFKADTDLRKAKREKAIADAKAGSGDVDDADFSSAIGAYDASEESRKSTMLICKCSSTSPDNLCGGLGVTPGSSGTNKPE